MSVTLYEYCRACLETHKTVSLVGTREATIEVSVRHCNFCEARLAELQTSAEWAAWEN